MRSLRPLRSKFTRLARRATLRDPRSLHGSARCPTNLPAVRAVLRRRLPGLCCAAAAAGLAAGAAAQTAPERSPAARAPAAAAAQPGTFRSGVTLIRTDVIVRDADGVFVADLAPSDFRVKEDGMPQEVASLVLVHGGRVFNQLSPTQPAQEGIILPSSRPRNQIAGRIFIFFVDAMHLEPQSTPRVRHFVKDVIDILVHDGDLVGLIANDSAGTAIDITYDRELVKSSVDGIVGTGLTPRELIMDVQDNRDGPAELRWRAHRAFFTVNTLLENLEAVQDRRKVLMYVSTGYDLNPFELQRLHRVNRADRYLRERLVDLAANDPEMAARFAPFDRIQRQGAVFSDGELIAEMDELADAASRANTTFYTLDPRGLVSTPDIDYDVPLEAWREYQLAARSSLRTLAELTGGISIVNTNNFEGLLRQIDAETSDYYIVGYYTSNPDPAHRRRTLDVSVARDGVSVRSRTSYTFSRTPAGPGAAGGR